LANFDRNALTGKVIDYRQQTNPAAIKQLIRHEIHGPAIVNASRFGPIKTLSATDTTLRRLGAQTSQSAIKQALAHIIESEKRETQLTDRSINNKVRRCPTPSV